MKPKISMIKLMRVWGVIFSISLAAIFISYEIYNTYKNFNLRADEIRKEYTLQQENIIKGEVTHVADMIKYNISKLKEKQDFKNFLQNISKIRFGKEGYIFINKFNGDALISNGKVFSGKRKLWEIYSKNEKEVKHIFQKEVNAAEKKGGDYIFYSFLKLTNAEKKSPKVSYIYGVPELKWIVGAGVYLDDVENTIANMKDNLGKEVRTELFYSILIVISIIALYLFLFNYLLKRLEKDLEQFNSFFKNAASNNEFIDLKQIKFKRFGEMAKNANNMLKDKILAQNELINEKEKLFVTIRSIGDGLITTDKNGNIDLINTVAEKLTGWSNEEAKGKPLTEVFNIIDEKTKEQVENPANRVLRENKIIGLSNHTILVSKNGKEYNIADSAAPIKDGENNVKGVVLVFRDVTAKYKIQEELKKSEERYNRLSSLTYEGILIHKDGIAIDANKAIEKISGYNAEELIGKNIIQLLVPEKYHKKIIENMKNKVIMPYQIESIKKDGTIIPIEIESRNITYNDSENDIRVTAIRDISQRKKNELEILKLSNAIEQAPVTVIITDKNGNIEYVNPKFTEVTGYSLKEMLGKDPKILESGEQSEEFYEEIWDTILAGKLWSGEFHNKKKNGELFWESAKISPIKNEDGEITHFVVLKEDITEKKKMLDELVLSQEKAVNADKMKSIFLAQMSHEIRTPINAMLSLSSLLRDDLADKIDDEAKLSFDLIGRAGMRIVRTVDLILNLSEIQAGTYEVINKSFNLYADILGKIIDEYKKLADDKGILLNIDLGTDNTEIVADSYTVDQIFTQLIDNALKYTDKGKIDVRIYRDKGGKLTAEISDTGIGIAHEYLSDLFTPFSQEEMGYTRKYEGNGIGLTLVKRYCELNNANIEVDSKKGIGTTFKINFN